MIHRNMTEKNPKSLLLFTFDHATISKATLTRMPAVVELSGVTSGGLLVVGRSGGRLVHARRARPHPDRRYPAEDLAAVALVGLLVLVVDGQGAQAARGRRARPARARRLLPERHQAVLEDAAAAGLAVSSPLMLDAPGKIIARSGLEPVVVGLMALLDGWSDRWDSGERRIARVNLTFLDP